MPNELNRRTFLTQGTLFIAGTSVLADQVFAQSDESPALRIALLTDIHYADKDVLGSRYYKESIEKLVAAQMELSQNPIDFAVELGDFIDSVKNAETDLHHLQHINKTFATISNKRHDVLGNHCVETLTKKEFLAEIEQEKSYYSFDCKHWHFVILDACFRQDGVAYGRNNADWTDTMIPQWELDWLRSDLSATALPSIVFVHQRLDLENKHAYSVKNADQVRNILERSGKVRLVLQGHDHKGDYKAIGGIPYCTLAAVIEGTSKTNNAFAVLEVMQDGGLSLHGFGKQNSRQMQ